MKGTRLSVATVLYGGTRVLADTLPVLLDAVSVVGAELVIVDNSPDDDVLDLVQSLLAAHRVTAIIEHRSDNPGFAASANRAIELATCPWVFLVNADVTVDSAALRAIVAHVDEKKSDTPTAISLVTAGEHTCGVSLDRFGYFSDRPVGSGVPCLGPSGGAALFERAAFLKAGGFREDFFAWGEDAELALRLWLDGVRCEELHLALPHVGGHSVQGLQTLRRKAHWLARNRLLLLRSDCSLGFRATFGSLQLGMMIVNGVVNKTRAGTWRAHFAGLGAGLFGPNPRLNPAHRSSERLRVRDFASYRRRPAA